MRARMVTNSDIILVLRLVGQTLRIILPWVLGAESPAEEAPQAHPREGGARLDLRLRVIGPAANNAS